jgi:hypothetical protein
MNTIHKNDNVTPNVIALSMIANSSSLTMTTTLKQRGGPSVRVNVSKNDVPFVTFSSVNILSHDVVIITGPTLDHVYATLKPDLIIDQSIMTYHVENKQPKLIDTWLVSFIGAIIMMRSQANE